MRRAKTTAEFVAEAKKIFGDLYDYSRVIYKKARLPVEIGCNKCGQWFFQTPDNHLHRKGCLNCSGRKKKTTEDFIAQARAIFGDLYGYDRVDYQRDSDPVEIECKNCGAWFKQRPNHHLKGHGCKSCASSRAGKAKSKKAGAYKRMTTAEFIEKSEKKYGTDVFDYARVLFEAMHKKVELGCKKCGGWFFRAPLNHLSEAKNRCPLCIANERRSKFYADAELKQGPGRYSLGEYASCRSDVEMTCNLCGHQFHKQASRITSQKISCPACGRSERMSSRGEDFIKRAQAKHGVDRYNYSRVAFDGAVEKVEIGCNDCGQWFPQTPQHHLEGSGCPTCSPSGFNPDKPALLYYVRFDLPSGDRIYKIGITNRTVQERFASEPLPYTILQETPFLFGWLAREAEKAILAEYEADRYDGEALVSGNTEAFVRDILEMEREIELSA